MKKIIILITTILISSHLFAQTAAENDERPYPYTDTEFQEEAYRSYTEADKELNIIYKKILTVYQSDTAFINNLKKSQRIWITFRDAELAVKYPNEDYHGGGKWGSICKLGYLNDLTSQRIKTLKIWLIGIEEGDVCGGSIRGKD